MTPPPRRLHFGCGWTIAPGWINCDIFRAPGLDLCADIRQGLPLADQSLDCIAAHHAMQDLKIYEQVPALAELRRILRPGGVLRLGLPDFDVFVAAYQRGDRDFFLIYDWDTIDGNFFTHLLWYNITQTPMTKRFMEELLRKAGFARVEQVSFKRTSSDWPVIVELDGRESESFYIEAYR